MSRSSSSELVGEHAPIELVLASASPRRAALLTAAGYSFRVQVADIDEYPPGAFPADTLCRKNAERKARAVAEQHPGALVIGCDTIVCVDLDVLGKPANRAEAHTFLKRLQGRTHEVQSGVSLVMFTAGYTDTFSVATEVTFRSLSDASIETYLDSIAFMDKAGAYAIQDGGDRIIESIQGSYTNVVGLPMERLEEALKVATIPRFP